MLGNLFLNEFRNAEKRVLLKDGRIAVNQITSKC